jgi:hypothetical protein
MPQNTNLNVSPYYDDFDKFKNFYKVLFRPGFPIQARELTTMQSILQNQVESLGTHFFKDGAMVIPGQVGFDNNVDGILVQSSFLGTNVEEYRTQLDGAIITGLTTGVKAKVIYSISSDESEKGFITFYVKYIEAGGDDKTIIRFLDNEQLVADRELTFGNSLLEIGSPFAQLLPNGGTTIASTAYVNTGVYFIRGYFIDVPYQYVILDQYGQDPSYRVGLEVSESIITSEDDPSLNDNAAGSSNYAAPGGHRFRIKTTLIKKTLDDTADKNFLELIRIVKGKVQQYVDRTVYNELEKELARRTYDQVGDFMIRPFDIKVRESLNDGFNNGVYLPGEVTQDTKVVASSELYAVEISPGKVYLKGYSVETTQATFLDLPKSREYNCLQNNIIPFELGNYTSVQNVYGAPVITGPDITSSYQIVELRSEFSSTPGVAAGNLIGVARVMNWEYSGSGGDLIDANSNDTYNLYLFDISLHTKLKLSASTTIEAGSQVVGRISGATGLLRVSPGEASYTGDTLTLTDVQGTFRIGEVIQVDGRDKGTVSAAPYTFNFSDTKQILGRNSAGSSIIFSCDARATEQYRLTGTYFTYTSGTGILTGFNSNIAPEVKPGDLLYISATQYFKVDSIPSSYNLSTIFNYSSQTIKVTPSAGFSPSNNSQYQTVVRIRPQLEGKQNGDLFTEMPKKAIKQITDESMVVRRTYESQVISNSFSISLAENEQFGSVEFENYNLTVTGVSGGSSYAVGNVIPLQTALSGSAGYATFNTSGTPRSTISVSNLVGITSVRLIASISKNVVTEKIKNSNKMTVWKVNRTSKLSDQIPFGLSYTNLYGTRIEDKEISLGTKDVYKLHAIYESYDDNEAQVPYVTLVESAFFQIGSLVTGKTSGAKGIVVDFSSTTLKLSVVYQTSNQFIQNETIIGVNGLGITIQGLVSDADGSIFAGSRNITSSFELHTGESSFNYGISYLKRRPGSSAPIRKLKIVADYFTHESTGDYFNIDSYVGIGYDNIPTYVSPITSVSTSDSQEKNLRDVLDFRPGVKDLVSGGGTVSNPFYLQCSSLDFNSRVYDAQATTFDIPKVNSDFRCDYCFYLRRMDTLSVDTLGTFFVTIGTPAEYPTVPPEVDNSMLLAVIAHEAYGFNPEVDSFIFKEDIRRYTMKDIALLDKRIKNVEYYSALNLLEQETNSLTIKDEFGNDKFKNGYLVDTFENQDVADLENPDYNASVDLTNRQMRPSHYTTNIPLQINLSQSSNISINNRIVTLPFTDQLLIEQPYASQVENVNPFNVFTFLGSIQLNPSSDDWVETQVAPALVTQIEGNFQYQAEKIRADQNGLGPAMWNAWVEDWSGSRTTVTNTSSWNWGNSWGVNRTVTTTGIIERRTGTQQRLVTRFDNRSLGSRIVSRQNVPFIRSRNVSFIGERLKPSSQFFGFFDNVPVSTNITPKIIELIKNPSEDAATTNNPFVVGENVFAYRITSRNATGGAITESIPIFRAKVAALNDGYRFNPYTDIELAEQYSSTTAYLNIDTDALASQANGTYFGNIEIGCILIGQTSNARAIVRDRRLFTDRKGTVKGSFFIPRADGPTNPRWATGRRTFVLSNSSTNQVGIPGGTTISNAQIGYEATGILETNQETILAVRNAEIVTDQLRQQITTSRTRNEQVTLGWYDPLAQSFIVQERGGCFISKVEVFFASKDQNIPVTCQIRTMENGSPTSKILPMSTVTVYPESVEISENASIPTTFKFPAPVYLTDTQEYCFAILSDSNEYTIWISEMGQVDITGDRTISAQPYAGVLFKSQNASTWSPNQLQDLKFNVYRANFDTSGGKLTLNNADLDIGNRGVINLRENPIETKKANLTLTMNDDLASYTLGSRIYQKTTNASATIIEVNTNASPNQITVTDIEGQFVQGDQVGDVITYPIVSSQSTSTLYVSTQVGVLTGNYAIGKTVTGQTSGATAIITGWNIGNGQLQLNYISDQFEVGEVLRQSNPVVDSTILSSPAAPVYAGDSYNKYISTPPSFASSERRVKILHSNHGMHDITNSVVISNAVSEVSPTTLRTSITTTDLTLSVADATAFHKTINGLPIGSDNPGYLRINGEIMAYTAITDENTSITIKSVNGRGISGGAAISNHTEGDLVECYNLDGIPLIEINKSHDAVYDTTLDTYEIETSSISSVGISGGGSNVTASQNVCYEVLTPLIGHVTVNGTDIKARLNSVTGTSIGGDATSEPSFVNTGDYRQVDINESNNLGSQFLVLSKVNENAKLSGNKSMTLECLLNSDSNLVSPVIDLDRCSAITTTSRINNPSNWQDAALATGDPHDAAYITRMISLDNQVSRSIKVYFDAYRPGNATIRVLYRAVPVGFAGAEEDIAWSFFNTDGSPDNPVLPVNDEIFKQYEYTASGLEFVKFQIKIAMSSTNQAKVPKIKYFRTIATAS